MKEPTDTTKKDVKKQNPLSRRKFLTNTALAVGAFSIVPRHVLGRGFIAPNDRINIGFIGLGKQGNGLAGQFVTNTDAQIVAGCDVWTTKTAAFGEYVGGLYAGERKLNGYKGITSYLDYKELLSRKDIDAVVIATPDHWHAIQAMDAMHAGKDVYCEKPLTHGITEGMELVEATKKTGKILQTGSMQRSWENFRKACELVRNGYLGEITKIIVNVGDPAVPYNMKGEPIPKELDWNSWCGPAPLLPYNHRLAPSRNDVDFWPEFRLFREVGGGILCDWGAHMFDIAQWALGMDHSGPVRYIPPSDRALVRGLRMFYANGIEMAHEDFGRGWGVRFIGSGGTMDISRNYFETNPENIKTAIPKDSDIRLYNSNGNHYQDWLDAIKNRTQPICDVVTGHRSASICNVANIAYQLGRALEWDPEHEQFKGDTEANTLRSRVNRAYTK